MDKRKRSRVNIGLTAKVITATQTQEVKTKNLSLKGVLVTPGLQIGEGTPCYLELILSPEIKMTLKGKIVRDSQQETAVDFIRMDPDTFFHLRNLVRIHAPDPDQIERELNIPAFDLDQETDTL